MSYRAALLTAIRQAEYYGEKRYVWGFKSARDGKWYYTVSEDRPDFMLHLDHIT